MPGFYKIDMTWLVLWELWKRVRCLMALRQMGDVAIAIASQGVHSNGFSWYGKSLLKG